MWLRCRNPRLRRGASADRAAGPIFRWPAHAARRCAWRGPASKAACVSTSSIRFEPFCPAALAAAVRHLVAPRSAQPVFDQLLAGQLGVATKPTRGGISTGSTWLLVLFKHPLQDLAGGGDAARRRLYPSRPTNLPARIWNNCHGRHRVDRRRGRARRRDTEPSARVIFWSAGLERPRGHQLVADAGGLLEIEPSATFSILARAATC